MRLCIHTDFDDNKPLTAIIRLKGKTTKINLFKRGTGVSIYEVNQRLKKIKHMMTKCLNEGTPIMTTNFKSHLSAYDLPLLKTKYEVYDLGLGLDVLPEDKAVSVLETMEAAPLLPYQKMTANAAVVYQYIQNRGIMHGGMLKMPIWSQSTYTGRSKTTGFSVHGCNEEDQIGSIDADDSWKFIHFDWISADIRIASILSQDESLNESFRDSDPYTYMEKTFGDDTITRSACKIALLKAINSLDVEDVVLSEIFPKLGEWISRCKKDIEEGKRLSTIMGKKFGGGDNKKAMVNAIMQGSVAHAMHMAMRNVWELYDDKLFLEVHDSLIMHCPPQSMKAIIKGVTSIMTRPFVGTEYDHFFPVKVSIGKRWKRWEHFATFREDRIDGPERSAPKNDEEIGESQETQEEPRDAADVIQEQADNNIG